MPKNDAAQHERPGELAQLSVFIGRRMTEGETTRSPMPQP
jgi:hypothetical protein